jgi:hypothetical protein
VEEVVTPDERRQPTALPYLLHQGGSGGGEFFELVGTDFGVLELE